MIASTKVQIHSGTKITMPTKQNIVKKRPMRPRSMELQSGASRASRERSSSG
jgi:hypothetical protein